MINMNSPTVQYIMNNTQYGQGNFNPAAIPFQQVNPGTARMQSPFPSPMEMSQQQNNLFAGYSNPYFNLGTSQPYYGFNQSINPFISPYGTGYGYQRDDTFDGYNPYDADSKAVMASAMQNGISYKDQLANESEILRACARLVKKSLGASEEEIKKAEERYEIKTIGGPKKEYYKRESKMIHVYLENEDGDIKDPFSNKSEDLIRREIELCPRNVKQVENDEKYISACRVAKHNRAIYLYNNSINRKADNMDLLQILNQFSANWTIQDELDRTREQQRKAVGLLYNRDEYRKLQQKLAANNGGYSNAFGAARARREQQRMLHGGYGYMPGGIPTTPGREYIGSSFSLDPKTGALNVECPQVFKDRIQAVKNRTGNEVELMRQRFIETCMQGRDRERMAGHG